MKPGQHAYNSTLNVGPRCQIMLLANAGPKKPSENARFVVRQSELICGMMTVGNARTRSGSARASGRNHGDDDVAQAMPSTITHAPTVHWRGRNACR